MMKKMLFLSINLFAISWLSAQAKIPALKKQLNFNQNKESTNQETKQYKILNKKVDSGYYMQTKTANTNEFSTLKNKPQKANIFYPTKPIKDTIK